MFSSFFVCKPQLFPGVGEREIQSQVLLLTPGCGTSGHRLVGMWGWVNAVFSSKSAVTWAWARALWNILESFGSICHIPLEPGGRCYGAKLCNKENWLRQATSSLRFWWIQDCKWRENSSLHLQPVQSLIECWLEGCPVPTSHFILCLLLKSPLT